MTKPTVAVRMNESQLEVVIDAMEARHTNQMTPAETEAYDHMLQRMRKAFERVTNKGL